jgi:cytochrome P450
VVENFSAIIVDPKTYADERLYHETFSRLRTDDPVHRCEPQDYRPFWAVTRHADIMDVELDAKNFANDPRQFLVTKTDEDMLFAQTGSTNFARNLVAMDDPDHRAYRALTAPWFGQKSVKRLESEISTLARETVDKMVAMGSTCDFAKEIAAWYPLRTIMLVLGVPREDEPLMLSLSQKIFGSTDTDTGGGEGMTSMVEASKAFGDYFNTVTENRRKEPSNDIASVLANATVHDKPIGEAERHAYFLIIAAAGHDTTSSAISGGLLALIRHPQQMAKLRADPTLMPKAVDEFVRWTSPVKHFFRTARADCLVGGKQIRAGDSLMMCYPSGNRDERAFEDPFDFRIDRFPNRHLAFGYGPHLCLGQHLAKLEMRILFEELFRRIDDFELAGEPALVEANFVSGLKRLPIRYHATA